MITIYKFFSKENIAYILLMAIVFTLPISYNIPSYIIIVWSLWAIYYGVMNHEKIDLNSYKSLMILLIAVFVIDIIGLLFTKNVSQGMRIISKDLPFLLFPLLFLLTIQDKNKLKIIFDAFTYLILLLCLICYFNAVYITGQLFPLNDESNFYYSNAFSRLSYTNIINGIHPGYFSWYIFFCLLCVINRYSVKKKNNYIIYIAIPIYVLTLVLLGSKVAISLLLIYILSKGIKKLLIGKIAISISLIVCLFIIGSSLFFNKQFRYRVENELENSFKYKQQQWSSTFEVIKKNPIIGTGTGDFQDELDKVYSTKKQEMSMGLNSHNQFLQYLGRNGIVLFLILTFLCFKLYKNSRKTKYLFFGLLTFGFLFFESVLERQRGVMFFVIIILTLEVISIENKNEALNN